MFTEPQNKYKKNDKPYSQVGFAKGSLCSVLLAFSQSYVEHNLRKIKL
jgi:hypothetical protein